MKLIVKLSTANHDNIYLSNKYEYLFEKNIEKVEFGFGEWSQWIDLKFKEDFPENQLEIPIRWKELFTIPDIQYELKLFNNKIKVGPIICFAPSRTRKALHKHLQHFQTYYENNQNVNGLLFLCATNDINRNNNMINGFYYDSTIKTWKNGTFPLPDVLFRRAGFSHKTYRFLKKKLGKRLFNGPFYNKWQVWKLLTLDNQVKNHLPFTVKLTKKNLGDILTNYGEAYLKPINGLRAKGIYKVTKTQDQYQFNSVKGASLNLSENEVDPFLASKKNYICQQSIKTDQTENRNIVLRVILQKNRDQNWQCSGSYARIGKKNSIATNRHLTAHFCTIGELFQQHYQMSDEHSKLKQLEMVELCKVACTLLEKKGSYGDVAFDLMMDENNKFWILEINHRCHNYLSPLQTVRDDNMFKKVQRMPFEYAKSLAGFSDEK